MGKNGTYLLNMSIYMYDETLEVPIQLNKCLARSYYMYILKEKSGKCARGKA